MMSSGHALGHVSKCRKKCEGSQANYLIETFFIEWDIIYSNFNPCSIDLVFISQSSAFERISKILKNL